MLHVDVQQRQAGDLFDTHVLRTRNGFKDFPDLLSGGKKRIEVVTKDLHGHVAADAGDQFVETHLDRLKELVFGAGHLLDGVVHSSDEFLFGQGGVRPFGARLEHHITVGHTWRHRIGGDLGSADFRESLGDFREFLEGGLHRVLQVDRLCETGAGNSETVNCKVSFVQIRNELAAHAAGEQEAEGDHDCRRHSDHSTMCHTEAQRWEIGHLHGTD